MSVLDDSMLLYRVAKYYYENEYSQEEISKIEHISRAQVSRLLKKAKDSKIVKIEVVIPDSQSVYELSERLKKYLNIKNVIISPSVEKQKDNDENLYSVASSYLSKNLIKYKNIGIGWGKTLYNISLQLLNYEDESDLVFCPLVGNSGTENPHLQTNSITDRFSERFKGRAFYSNLLMLEKRDDISEISFKRLAKLKEMWNNLDVAVIGLGGETTSNKHLYVDELPEVFYNNEDINHIIGDVLGDFYMNDGTLLQFPSEYEKISITSEQLKNIHNVICIAHGEQKVRAIEHISREKFINTLITDEYTARMILDKFQI